MPIAAPSDAGPASPVSGHVWKAIGAALLAAGALTIVLGLRTVRRAPDPPRLGMLPEFRLVERTGQAVSLADLQGRPWVADFIFTQCGGACPAMTARMARLRREVPAEVRLVSFTVDPAHDTPDVLARYARAFGADGSWLFVTGAQKDLYDLSTGGFKLAAMEVPPDQRSPGGDGPFLHSSKFTLVDAEGAIRGYYDSTDEQAMRALATDATALGLRSRR
jgi:protein SCO1/2